MSSSEAKPQRARASSAKASRDRPRPSSGHSSKQAHKIDLIENMYGLFSTKRGSSKPVPSKLGLLGEEGARGQREREELAEENLQLKRENNQLREELCLQKGRTEQLRRKNSEFTKKLNVEYEKELYWTNPGPNLVRGVKQQYEQIKLKYQEKCQECDALAQTRAHTEQEEERAHLEALQADNRKLARRVAEAQEEMRYSQHGTLTSAVEESIELYKRYKFEIQQENDNLREQGAALKLEVRLLREEGELKGRKIAYLDKLLVERDNSQHAAWRKAKRLEKEKGELAQEYAQYRREQEEAAVNYEQRVLKMRESLERQSETERLIFRKELQQKSVRIGKLEKEIAYLTTLLSYWKPLDEVNHLVSQVEGHSADYDREVVLEYSMGSTMIKHNVSRQQRVASSEEEEARSIAVRSRKGSGDNPKEAMSRSIDIARKEEGKRVQVTADRRCTEESVKARKVQHSDILDICETLRYRFIGFGVPMEEVRGYFDYEGAGEGEEEEWRSAYISMREVTRILRNELFGLSESDALLLSRYLIEDSPNDYVYCDPNNEHLRSVVKSIVRTVVGEYSLPPDRRAVEAELRALLERYEGNLQSALKVVAPKGVIGKKKLLELLKGLGIETSAAVEEQLLGRAVIHSASLSSLRVSVLLRRE